jgi:hypothetical protein
VARKGQQRRGKGRRGEEKRREDRGREPNFYHALYPDKQGGRIMKGWVNSEGVGKF